MFADVKKYVYIPLKSGYYGYFTQYRAIQQYADKQQNDTRGEKITNKRLLCGYLQ